MQTFFLALGHELKTPLTNIRLQTEILNEKIAHREDLTILLDRVIESTQKLEHEFDKILQLSRLERGAPLNSHPLLLRNCFLQVANLFSKDIECNITNRENDQNIHILADEYALRLIFRNLLENTLEHSTSPSKGNKKRILIDIKRSRNQVHFSYEDLNAYYGGDSKKLGQLFYKFKSPNGSGIGLYLISKLMSHMQGTFKILMNKESKLLSFHLTFPLARGSFS